MILFVVEGKSREPKIFKRAFETLFKGKQSILNIIVPVGTNIYSFYEKMEKLDFDCDPIEILREWKKETKKALKGYKRNDFSEIYYFFDFDEHDDSRKNKKLSNVEVLKLMLEFFNNETEQGKLYISYPMIEAVRDYVPNDCSTKSESCFCNKLDFKSYKNNTSKNNKVSCFSRYNFKSWCLLLESYLIRICCLFKTRQTDRGFYIEHVTPKTIYEEEMTYYSSKCEIFVISSLPEFLLDYSSMLWNKTIGSSRVLYNNKECFTEPTKTILDD